MGRRKSNLGRKTAGARHMRIVRAKETPQQREFRLSRDRLRAAIARANETLSERHQRLTQARIRSAARLKTESPLKREERLATGRLKAACRREWETLAQRKERLIKDRMRMAARRRTETPIQRERRLIEGRLRRTLECSVGKRFTVDRRRKKLFQRPPETVFIGLQMELEEELDQSLEAANNKEDALMLTQVVVKCEPLEY